MASTYSDLKIELIGTGDQSGTWGGTTNDNLGIAIEQAITGSGDVTFAGVDVTLTLSNTNASQTARNLRLRLTGTSGGARNLIVPGIKKQYIVKNDTADTVTIKNASGTGVAIPTLMSAIVFNDGTNITSASIYSSSLTTPTLAATDATFVNALPVASGGTGTTTTPTGTGAYVRATSPTLVTPALGTPSALVGTNITGTAASFTVGNATTATNQSGGTVSATTGTFSGIASFAAGSATNPSITFSSNTSTGIFLPTGNTMAFTKGGVEAMRISSSGSVGIGTSVPNSIYRLDVVGDVRITDPTEATLLVSGGTCDFNLTAYNGDYAILSGTGGSKGVAISMGGTGVCVFDNASSNVGVDVLSPLVKLDVDGQIKGRFTSVGTNIAAQALATNHVSAVTISLDTTLTTTVPAAGAQALVIIVTSGTTSRTVTFGTGFATTGTLATGATASRRFVVSFISDGTRLIECSRTTAITV